MENEKTKISGKNVPVTISTDTASTQSAPEIKLNRKQRRSLDKRNRKAMQRWNREVHDRNQKRITR